MKLKIFISYIWHLFVIILLADSQHSSLACIYKLRSKGKLYFLKNQNYNYIILHCRQSLFNKNVTWAY